MAAVRTVEAVRASVFLEPCLGRGHVLHTVGAVVGVDLVRDTEAAPKEGREELRNGGAEEMVEQ